jgi:hypothetical protein
VSVEQLGGLGHVTDPLLADTHTVLRYSAQPPPSLGLGDLCFVVPM